MLVLNTRYTAPNGYTYGATKADRQLDPYLGQVETPDGKSYDSGLFSTSAKALSWAKKRAENAD